MGRRNGPAGRAQGRKQGGHESSKLALTIKSRIPREITADRAVGAGGGSGSGRRESRVEDRQQQTTERERENDGGTAAVYRLADKFQGAGLSAGRRGR